MTAKGKITLIMGEAEQRAADKAVVTRARVRGRLLSLGLGMLVALLPLAAVAQDASGGAGVDAPSGLSAMLALVLTLVSNYWREILTFALVSVTYLAPTIIACARGKQNIKVIFLLNYFGGWTLVGWVVTYFWAFLGERKEVPLPESRESGTESRFLIVRLWQTFKSPWYYWHTGERRVAIMAWGTNALVAVAILVIPAAIVCRDSDWMWTFIMVLVGALLEASLFPVILLLFLLYWMIPDWVPEWIRERIADLVADLVCPLLVGASLGFFLVRVLAYFFSKWIGHPRPSAQREAADGE